MSKYETPIYKHHSSSLWFSRAFCTIYSYRLQESPSIVPFCTGSKTIINLSLQQSLNQESRTNNFNSKSTLPLILPLSLITHHALCREPVNEVVVLPRKLITTTVQMGSKTITLHSEFIQL